MWIDFFVATAFILVILYVPGYLLSRCVFRDRFSAMLCSPLVSIASIVLLGIVYDLADVSVPWFALVIPALLIGAVLFFAVFRSRGASVPENARFRWLSLACYVLVGAAIAMFYYVRCLDGPESFAQIFDNAAHLNTISSYADSARYSIFHSTLYLEGSTSGSSPVTDSGFAFYPAAWHIIGAIACNALSVSAAIAENAVNFAFAGFVFPASVCMLFHLFFRQEKRIILCGAFCCLAFEAFPWGMMMFGPLYPNMMSFCVLPLVLYCVASLFSFEKGQRLKFVTMTVVGGFTLGASQPNAIFTAIVLLLPYCVYRTYRFTREVAKSRAKALGVASILVVLLGAVWVALWFSPSFQGVVSYPWPAFASKAQSVVNVLTLSLRDSPAQPLLGAFVLLGVAYTLLARRFRWLVWSYGFAVLMYCVSASTDGILKSLLSGFWYTDAYRVSAVLALTAIPLSALGLSATIGALHRCMACINEDLAKKNRLFPAIVVIVSFLAITFAPAHTISGVVNVDTAFSRVTGGLEWLAAPGERKYTVDESGFVEKAKDIISQDPGVVANFPYDGSVFSYGADGIDIYYRSFYSFGGASETQDSKLIRTSLDRIASDQDVAEAASRANVKYVLLLDTEAEHQTLHEDLYSEKDRPEWQGLLGITPETEGFELVLSQGDMQLYKVQESQ